MSTGETRRREGCFSGGNELIGYWHMGQVVTHRDPPELNPPNDDGRYRGKFPSPSGRAWTRRIRAQIKAEREGRLQRGGLV